MADIFFVFGSVFEEDDEELILKVDRRIPWEGENKIPRGNLEIGEITRRIISEIMQIT